MPRPLLFWDSAALIRAVMAGARDPHRRLPQLGELDVVDMRISRDVAREVEAVLRRYGDDLLGDLAAIMDRARFAVTLDPSVETVNWCEELTGYRPDAKVVAAAHECSADALLTYDRQHLLDNPLHGLPDLKCRVMSPENCLEWLRIRIHDETDSQ